MRGESRTGILEYTVSCVTFLCPGNAFPMVLAIHCLTFPRARFDNGIYLGKELGCTN